MKGVKYLARSVSTVYDILQTFPTLKEEDGDGSDEEGGWSLPLFKLDEVSLLCQVADRSMDVLTANVRLPFLSSIIPGSGFLLRGSGAGWAARSSSELLPHSSLSTSN